MNPNNENLQNENENKEEVLEKTNTEDLQVILFNLIFNRIKEKRIN